MTERIIHDRTPVRIIHQNLRGLTGPQGVGAAWHVVETGLPGSDLGSDGDYALVQDTLCIYGPRATADEVTDWPYIACIAGTVLAADIVAALEAAAAPSAENPYATADDLSAVAAAIPDSPDDLGAAAQQGGHINGQVDTRTDLTATNGATVTLDYAAGNAFVIDASAMTAGQAFTVAISNLPAGAVFAALSLILLTGANLPTVTWPTGVSAPTLQASKEHWYTLASRNNGTAVRLFTAGVF